MGAVLLFNFLLYFGVVLIKKKKDRKRWTNKDRSGKAESLKLNHTCVTKKKKHNKQQLLKAWSSHSYNHE